MKTKIVKGKRVRMWKKKSSAKADLKKLQRRLYKVKLTDDKKGVIIIGKTTRGEEKTRIGRRAMLSQTMRRPRIPGLPRKKPDETYEMFRQPCFTLRRFGWAH